MMHDGEAEEDAMKATILRNISYTNPSMSSLFISLSPINVKTTQYDNLSRA